MATKGLYGEIAAAMVRAQRVLFVTGAGISRDSGLPVYRGEGGMFNRGADGASGRTIMESLSSEMLNADPATTWTHLSHVGARMAKGAPNDGHRHLTAIQDLMSRAPLPCVLSAQTLPALDWTHERCIVVTQNIDGFHRTAHTRDLVEIHGNASRFYCSGCARPVESSTTVGVGTWKGLDDNRADMSPVAARCHMPTWATYEGDFTDPINLPYCVACGSVVRPDVALFGEILPQEPLRKLQSIRADVCFLVGTSAQFPYVVDPYYDTSHRNGLTVNINPTDDGADELRPFTTHHLKVPATEALTDLHEALSQIVL
jgi:NAD-dependent deacetylase